MNIYGNTPNEIIELSNDTLSCHSCHYNDEMSSKRGSDGPEMGCKGAEGAKMMTLVTGR